MDKKDYFLLRQITRFGAVTTHQLQRFCNQLFGRATLYRRLRRLIDNGYIEYTSDRFCTQRAYKPTFLGYETVYGKGTDIPLKALRPLDFFHTLDCAETMMALCQHEKTIGIATESEIDIQKIKRFCFERRPDGVALLDNDGSSLEVAVEVERSVKSEDRVNKLLLQYEKTFDYDMPCDGLLIVATNPFTFRNYQIKLQHLPRVFRDKIWLESDPMNMQLDKDVFGQKRDVREIRLGITAKSLRTHSQGLIQYLPVKTGSYEFNVPL